MKAAVIHKFGDPPRYEDFADPIRVKENDSIVSVKAASIKNIDKARASGSHYDRSQQPPFVVGMDGVGILEDGRRIYLHSPTGMMAEKAVVSLDRCFFLPDEIDDIRAAAIPNPGVSAWVSLLYRAGIKSGEHVLILGATGVTGKLAIQLAKYFGAGKIIAAGRNMNILNKLPDLGASDLVQLGNDREEVRRSLQSAVKGTHIDIVLDYTWGWPAELVLAELTGHSLWGEAQRTRYISVGSMAGPTLQLSSETLRSSAIEIMGVGGGSISKEIMRKLGTEILPELFRLVGSGKLIIDTEVIPLRDIEQAWQRHPEGKRIVMVP